MILFDAYSSSLAVGIPRHAEDAARDAPDAIGDAVLDVKVQAPPS